MEPFLVSCALVAAAEMGDKTQLLAFLLAGRLGKPWPIIAGILVATLLNHSLAGGLGYLLGGWLSHTAMLWITGLSFIAFGLWTLHPDSLDDRLELAGAAPSRSPLSLSSSRRWATRRSLQRSLSLLGFRRRCS